MAKNKSFILSICAVVCAILLTLLIFKAFDIHLNLVTYHSFEQNGYSFKFKGSFDTVRKVKISKNGEKLGSFDFDSTSDVFFTEFGYKAEFVDVNSDDQSDILLPCAIDQDGDRHITIFFVSADDTISFDEQFKDLPNVTVDGGLIYTEEMTRETIAEGNESHPEFYARKQAITKYQLIGDELRALEQRAITYYSENDYCCYSIYQYNEGFKELTYVDEKWFEPDQMDKYPLNWD